LWSPFLNIRSVLFPFLLSANSFKLWRLGDPISRRVRLFRRARRALIFLSATSLEQLWGHFVSVLRVPSAHFVRLYLKLNAT
jgi:hypothetical protein